MQPQPPRFRINNHERGAALLSLTLAVALILTAVGLSLLSSGLSETLISHTQGESREAYAGAQSGAKDAMMRIARDKNFTSAGYVIPSGCALNGAALCTRVIVENTQSACSQALGANQDCVIVTGTLSSRTRKIEVILNVDATSGKITQVSWKEL